MFSIDLSSSFISLSMVISILPLRHRVICNFRYFIFIVSTSAENFYFSIHLKCINLYLMQLSYNGCFNVFLSDNLGHVGVGIY